MELVRAFIVFGAWLVWRARECSARDAASSHALLEPAVAKRQSLAREFRLRDVGGKRPVNRVRFVSVDRSFGSVEAFTGCVETKKTTAGVP